MFQRNGLQASLRTLGFEQAASFYLARGLPNALAERYARACVILVVMRSSRSDGTISTRLGDWRVRPADGAALRIRGRGDWLAELDRAKVTPEARMAFEWVQFPEDADLHAGDSIQGMLSVPVSRGSVFSLIVRWQSGDDRHEASIDTIRCD